MRAFFILILFLHGVGLFSQNQNDLAKSVPLWFEYDSSSTHAVLRWIPDDRAIRTVINTVDFERSNPLTSILNVEEALDSFALGPIDKGIVHTYAVQKSVNGLGVGIITFGEEIPIVHTRGRCLIAIDKVLSDSIAPEIDQLILDIEGDGWSVDTIHIYRTDPVTSNKARFQNWYDEAYQNEQCLFILGRVAVPYSGNSAYDGHGNHQGAWAADVFYGEFNGLWTDNTVNNTSPSRQVNKNIPNDGKYDQSSIPTQVELEIGRVDFHSLPLFDENEIELSRKYLRKNHAFRTGQKQFPRRAIVENNFGGFAEGFGQNAWRNFVPMFGEEQVSVSNYEVVLDTSAYLCSYACGAGSYTSMGGVGNTENLWKAKEIQTVFTMTFGSYFGDWDSNNNFLRSALASGDILCNAWAGRPNWHFYPMALGKNIGYCARLTQNARNSGLVTGFGGASTHVALMGDPTLRLHPVIPSNGLDVVYDQGDNLINWKPSPDASHGYAVYRKIGNSNWTFLGQVDSSRYLDGCVYPDTMYTYMIKAIKLERSASGSYYNTSIGIKQTVAVPAHDFMSTYYQDLDGDGFGNKQNDTLACDLPVGFVVNFDDCNDVDTLINPNASDIPNNGIDEDCDGSDLIVSQKEELLNETQVYPIPALDQVIISGREDVRFQSVKMFSSNGQEINPDFVRLDPSMIEINISYLPSGIYLLQVDLLDGRILNRSIVKQ